MTTPIEVEECSGRRTWPAKSKKRLTKAALALRIAGRHFQNPGSHSPGLVSRREMEQRKNLWPARGQLSHFSTERLMHFLTLLGDLETVLKRAAAPKPPSTGRQRRLVGEPYERFVCETRDCKTGRLRRKTHPQKKVGAPALCDRQYGDTVTLRRGGLGGLRSLVVGCAVWDPSWPGSAAIGLIRMLLFWSGPTGLCRLL